ncbi:hypothetical protein scyTo_0020117 [Scyliorhinus torazame]|uniref:Uncharacterized protein n=1 Tax=Scyliorhinus torazame TaxID=75743 RepID=A0A401PZC9_SCYTO|nr:hypothetical protein [Scyliorhinus torazame]
MEFGPSQVIEMDTCKVDQGICGHGVCVHDPSGYTCACHLGYQLHSEIKKCVDLNECDNNPCGPRKGKCVNFVGTYSCACYRGYQLHEIPEGSICVDVNECAEGRLCANGRCQNTEGSFYCRCHAGYRLVSHKTACEDINECHNVNACLRGKCKNKPGTYECVPCPEGYRSQAGECYDVDECLDRSFCINGKCINTKGSYSCTCSKGFKPAPDGKSCLDINECSEGRLCANGRCFNTEGSFQCRCHPGYRLSNRQTSCEDNNECLEVAGACNNGECVNMPGSYTYVDECQDVQSCPNGRCVNSKGSFSCICPLPMIFDKVKRRCVQPVVVIDRADTDRDFCWKHVGKDFICSLPLHGHRTTFSECCCQHGQAWGMGCHMCPMRMTASFSLLCNVTRWLPNIRPGRGADPRQTEQTDVSQSSDDNSSDDDSEECSCRHGRCARGRSRCECYKGFQLDSSGKCRDINECRDLQRKRYLCKNARCTNTVGSYRCTCYQGFVPTRRHNICIRRKRS